MTIRDIARLAGVSVATVSKVLNDKDKHISQETRDKIKRIALENDYEPYAEALSKRTTKLIGILFGRDADFSLLAGITIHARQMQYNTIVSVCGSNEEERENLSALLSQHVDGIILVTSPSTQPDTYSELELQDVPFCVLDEHGVFPQGKFYSYEELGFKAARYFVDLGHRRIACVSSKKSPRLSLFGNGIRRRLFESGIYVEAEDVCVTSDECDSAWLQTHTGVICLDSKSMAKIANLVDHLNLHITRDLSIASLCSEEWTVDSIHIAKIIRPYEELGAFSVENLVRQIERKEIQDNFITEACIDSFTSLAPPPQSSQQKFVVVGMANMDTLISVDKQLEPGETVRVSQRMTTPGGKGLNQALGIAKLGETATLIASLGSDLDGRKLFECLKENKVDTSGIFMHEDAPSGHAYVHVQADSESSISVFGGANALLTVSQIIEKEALFAGASCCLLETEIAQPVILQTAKIAKKHGLKVIMKPCAISTIDSNLLQYTDILVPNQKEAQKLVPQYKSVEEQADYFYRRGVKTVIITLADHGCYKRDKNGGIFFPAIPVSPVDATGAADSFVATLAVYLSKGKPINEAIKYATCAAGLSTMRHGVPPSLVDRDTLETYYSVHHLELQERRL